MAKVKINTGAVFERHEKKYRVLPAQYTAIRELLAAYTREDQYALHTICSLYYDTDDFAVIRHSLDKPKFKEKLRLRSYGVPQDADTVYLELKKKLDGVTYKRRIALPLQHARDYLDGGVIPTGVDAQILREIDWHRKQRRLSAKALLCYDRIALYGRQDADLRITFDANIRWREEALDLRLGDYGSSLLRPGERLMEIKLSAAMPLWLSAALAELGLYPQSFSKYGTVYQEYLQSGCGRELRHAG